MTTATPDTVTFEDVTAGIKPTAHWVCEKCHPAPFRGVLDANGVHARGVCGMPLASGKVHLEDASDYDMCQECNEIFPAHWKGHQ